MRKQHKGKGECFCSRRIKREEEEEEEPFVWKTVVRFTQTFEFASEHPIVYVVVHIIKEKIFEQILVPGTNFHQCNMTIHNWMHCYNLMGELDDDDPIEINIP